MRLSAFFLGSWIYALWSFLVTVRLRIMGVRVGRNLRIQGIPFLKLRGDPRNLVIGDNVTMVGDIDIRNRENGRIVIGDNVQLDVGCRLVAANDAVLEIQENCRIGCYSIFNCGSHVIVGKDTLTAGFCYVQSSNHGVAKGQLIRDQNHTYGKIHIGADVWLAAHVTVLAGVTIGDGAVVGANAVVATDLPANSISVGIPAKPIKQRV